MQSTLHFQKRIEKELKLMTKEEFLENKCKYSVSSYYYRVEFQQRGAPHIHCLLWLQDSDDVAAPTFWSSNEKLENPEERIKEIEKIASMLISASEKSAICDKHNEDLQIWKTDVEYDKCTVCFSSDSNFEECERHKEPLAFLENCTNCIQCKDMRNLVKAFQRHKHTFSCQKKNKLITIQETEGHGRNDNVLRSAKISNYVQCRYNFPQFPMNKTKFILGMSKELDIEEKENRKKDLQKIKKYLIRQTFSEDSSISASMALKQFQELSFIQFLYDVGMFKGNKKLEECSRNEKDIAYKRYIAAISASIKGSGSVFLQRDTKDVMTNNFNRRIMEIHQANHDVQIVVDQV